MIGPPHIQSKVLIMFLREFCIRCAIKPTFANSNHFWPFPRAPGLANNKLLTRIAANNPRCKGNFPIGEKSPTLYCWPAGPTSVHSANKYPTDWLNTQNLGGRSNQRSFAIIILLTLREINTIRLDKEAACYLPDVSSYGALGIYQPACNKIVDVLEG